MGERTCDGWFVLSARHGLVDPDRELAPYERTLKDASHAERREWSQRVVGELRRAVGDLRGVEFEIHAGREYADFGLESGLRAAGATVIRPARGLGLGEQLALYRGTGNGMQRSPTVESRGVVSETGTSPGGKYGPLRDWLASHTGPVVMSWEEIEALVGPLPASARKHRPWWANDPSHTQALAWLSVGRKVEVLDALRGRVRFGAPHATWPRT